MMQEEMYIKLSCHFPEAPPPPPPPPPPQKKKKKKKIRPRDILSVINTDLPVENMLPLAEPKVDMATNIGMMKAKSGITASAQV